MPHATRERRERTDNYSLIKDWCRTPGQRLYESLSAAVTSVRQVSAKAAVQNDSAPTCVPYVADDRCVSSG